MDNHRSKTRMFILGEMLKGKKMVTIKRYGDHGHGSKRQEYHVGEARVNSTSAIRIIESGLVKSIGGGRYEITRKGREFYSKGDVGISEPGH